MRVTLDMDPRDVWAMEEEAERRGVTPGTVLRERLTRKRSALELRERIRERVKAGMCDAHIAQEFRMTTTAVSEIRRGMGLAANPHPERGKGRKVEERKN